MKQEILISGIYNNCSMYILCNHRRRYDYVHEKYQKPIN